MALEELCDGGKENGPRYLIAAPKAKEDGGFEVEYLRDPVIEPGQIVVPGSFNPIHEGHEGLATRVAEIRKEMGESHTPGILFELCITNADKGTQPTQEIHRRASEVVRRGHRLLITKATLYKSKALLCQGCDFVVGYDTYKRIVNPKYYVPSGKALEGSSEEEHNEWVQGALEELKENGIRLFVAGRTEDDGTFLDLETAPLFELPSHLKSMVLPVTGFRMDISSTVLRAKAAQEAEATAS